jgi:hypothetical protein
MHSRATTTTNNRRFTYPTYNRLNRLRRRTYTVRRYRGHRQEDRRVVCRYTDQAIHNQPPRHNIRLVLDRLNLELHTLHRQRRPRDIRRSSCQTTPELRARFRRRPQELQLPPRNTPITQDYHASLRALRFMALQVAQDPDQPPGSVQTRIELTGNLKLQVRLLPIVRMVRPKAPRPMHTIMEFLKVVMSGKRREQLFELDRRPMLTGIPSPE